MRKQINYMAEEIDGFLVTEMMKRFWASCVEGLKEIDRICKKHDIKYFLFYGSLLGAVRHGGFIPWDDDLDIAMLRKDYNRFMAVAKDELRQPFYIDHLERDSCLFASGLRNTYYPNIDEAFLNQFHGCPYSLAIDIFPLDNLPDKKSAFDEYLQIFGIVKYLAQRTDPLFSEVQLPEFVKKEMDSPSEEGLEEVICGVEQYLNIKIERGKGMSRELSLLADKLAQRYKDVRCSNVGYTTNMYSDTPYIGNFPRECFDECIDIDFEGNLFPIPKGYERILDIIYGKKWRTPIRRHGRHDYPAYKNQAAQLEYLFKIYGAEAPDYFYL